jgi:hypothetical protein
MCLRDMSLAYTRRLSQRLRRAAVCKYLEMRSPIISKLPLCWTEAILIRYRFRVPVGCIRAEGVIKNVNTIEDFRATDYTAMLNTAGKQVALSDAL